MFFSYWHINETCGYSMSSRTPGESYWCFASFAHCVHLCSIAPFLRNSSLIMQTAPFHPFCVWFPKHPLYLSLRLLLSAPFQWQTGPWMRISIPPPTPLRHKRVIFSFTPLSHSLIVSESVFISVHAAICFSLHRISSCCIKPIFWQACRDYGSNENGHSWGECWNKISDCVFSFFRNCWFLSLMLLPVCIWLSVLVYRSVQFCVTVTQKYFRPLLFRAQQLSDWD